MRHPQHQALIDTASTRADALTNRLQSLGARVVGQQNIGALKACLDEWELEVAGEPVTMLIPIRDVLVVREPSDPTFMAVNELLAKAERQLDSVS